MRRKVDLGLLQDDMPVPGDWVLIHVGFAMSKISEQMRSTRCAHWRMLGEIEAGNAGSQGYGLDERERA